MRTYTGTRPLPYVPTDTADIIYPESDGKPMAETDCYIEEIIRMRQMLKGQYVVRPDVYVSGNILMYYVKGDVHQSVSPDILVSFGIGKKQPRTYNVWEEEKPPDFVLEFSSKGTYQTDLEDKMRIYASIGITEYFLYDAERRYLPSPLMAFRLVDKEYTEMSKGPDGGFISKTLGLSFHLLDESLGLYDPFTERWLLSAEEKIKQDTEEREKLQAEVERLQEELERLRNTSTLST